MQVSLITVFILQLHSVTKQKQQYLAHRPLSATSNPSTAPKHDTVLQRVGLPLCLTQHDVIKVYGGSEV
jgi:hypothetical protein